MVFFLGKDISCEITVWDGVVVSPLASAYEAQEKNAIADGDDFMYAAMDEESENNAVIETAS